MMILLAAAAASCPAQVTLAEGLEIPLVIVSPLSSKTSVKGDMVALQTSEDVRVDGVIVIAKGTAASGQVSDARAKGGMGMTGRISVSPLYLRVGDDVVRLIGATSAHANVDAATVAGVWLLPSASGRSATIAAGTQLPARVYHATVVHISAC